MPISLEEAFVCTMPVPKESGERKKKIWQAVPNFIFWTPRKECKIL